MIVAIARAAAIRPAPGFDVGCAIASAGISARSGIAATSWNSRIAKPSRTVRGLQFLALAQDLQIDRGRGQRQAEPDDERAFPVEPEREADAADDEAGQSELQAADAEHRAPHDPQPLRRELHADHEQHQHDAELGDLADLLGVADQADPRRADQRAGRKVAQHRAELPALGERHRDDRGEQQHDRVLQETVVHASSVPAIMARKAPAPGAPDPVVRPPLAASRTVRRHRRSIAPSSRPE